MSNNLFQFNFEHDQQPTENSYPISDVQWIYINDINQGNYSNGYINFTNVSVIGSDVSKQYLWSQGYLAIPYTITVVPTGMQFFADDSNVNALSIKSYASFIDWVSVKFNGVSCTRNSYYNHLVMNERIKTYNTDKYSLYGDLMAHSWDNGLGISYSATIGERNNNTLPQTTLERGNNPANIVNQGHLNRCAKTNIDITNINNSSLSSFFGTQTSLLNTENQNCLVYNAADGLVYQGVATIPLSELHDFFKNMPSVASSTGFELRLQSNVSRENSYTTRYGAIPINSAANGAGLVPNIPDLVTSQQIVGHCCPFLLSNPSGGTAITCGSTGLAINNTAAINAGSTITVKACIGWLNTTGQLNTEGKYPGSAGNPCRIYLPSVNYNNDYIKQIIQQPQYSLKYEDYYCDIDEGKIQGSSVSRLFNVQLSRVRNLYIIPFLSGGAFPSPFNSPISSAPLTASPCRLKNFNIQIGGSNVFSEPQNFNYQFYNNNTLSIMADINGNSLKSKFFSGQISKSMWENGYNVYSINLEKVTDEITDSLMKSFQLIYQIEDNTSQTKLKYDFYYIITYQSELSLDRTTGTVTNSL
jgi:hypothetical protein